MRLALLLAALVAGVATYGYRVHELRMLPDFDLYTAGGLGLFPSPVGRLLGAAGPDVFAAVSIACAGVCVLGVAAIARRAGGKPATSALLFTLSPACLYLSYAGIDSIGLALLLVGLAAPSSWMVAGAAVTHLSLVPFALVALPRSTWPARLLLGTVIGCAAAALLLTPYSHVVYGAFHPDALTGAFLGLLAGIVVSLPALAFLPRPWPRPYVLALAVGVAECWIQHHLQARYLLPAGALAAGYAVRPAWLPSTRPLSKSHSPAQPEKARGAVAPGAPLSASTDAPADAPSTA